MRIWYKYRSGRRYRCRSNRLFKDLSFDFCKDRKTFSKQNCKMLWSDIAPIAFKQFMIEAELTRKYKV